MTTAEKFGAWWTEKWEPAFEIMPSPLKLAWKEVAESAWKASRSAALEEAAKAIGSEMLDDPTDSADDIAYDNAVADCVCAVRALQD